MLRAFIEDLSSPGVPVESRRSGTAPRTASEPRAVMVIHGHDSEAARAMFDWLRAVDLQPLEWAQLVQYTDDASPCIGQVLDAAFARAQAVVALLTPDERVATREE